MSKYIVMFENNKAISSTKADLTSVDPINIEQVNNADEIKWMTVFAKSEERSIYRANEIADQIITVLHLSY
jgi:hypothetical protein